jgi:hypothetical protein
MHSRRITATVLSVTAGLVSAGILVGGTPVHAATPAPVVVNARCSGSSRANLQLQREDTGRLSIDFGVDMAAHKAGVVWKATVVDNTATVYMGSPKTIFDGSFSVTRVVNPQAGANKVTGTATNPATGETCRVAGTI